MLKMFAALSVAVLALYQSLKFIHFLVRQRRLRQQTGMLEVELLGEPRKDGKRISGAAVICGGSIAGLAAARICHDHFEQVIIVEPEGWLSTDDALTENILELRHKRSRLMQWESYQGTQVWTSVWFRKLFPDFEKECAASDIHVVMPSLIPAGLNIFFSGKMFKVPQRQYDGDLPKSICAARPGFETFLRRLIIKRKEYPNIKQIHGTVIGFEQDSDDSTCLSKVIIRQGDNDIVAIPATLILDCTGPARAGTKIISRLGFGIPDTRHTNEPSLDELSAKYDQSVQYSTYTIPVTDDQIKRFPEEARDFGIIGAYLPDSAEGESRMLFAQRVDRNVLQICSGQWQLGAPNLPRNLSEYETFARSLRCKVPVPEFWYQLLNILKETEEKATIKPVRIPPSVYSHFHRAVNMPRNWIAIGDSVMNVNPAFGQGITKVLLGTVSLNTLLHKVHQDTLPHTFAKEFFRQQADKIEPIWRSSKVLDYSFDSTKPLPGETLSSNAGNRWYLRQLQILATKDEHVGSVFWHVRMFLAPSIDVIHPDVVLKVLWEAIKGHLLS